MAAERRRRGALEQEVLGCLAASARALTVAQVQRALGGGLAYTTVLTTMRRLHAKGALSREAAGRGFAYAAPTDPVEVGSSVTARRMSRLLAADADHAGVLLRFVADLGPADVSLLSGLLAAGRHRRRG